MNFHVESDESRLETDALAIVSQLLSFWDSHYFAQAAPNTRPITRPSKPATAAATAPVSPSAAASTKDLAASRAKSLRDDDQGQSVGSAEAESGPDGAEEEAEAEEYDQQPADIADTDAAQSGTEEAADALDDANRADPADTQEQPDGSETANQSGDQSGDQPQELDANADHGDQQAQLSETQDAANDANASDAVQEQQEPAEQGAGLANQDENQEAADVVAESMAAPSGSTEESQTTGDEEQQAAAARPKSAAYRVLDDLNVHIESASFVPSAASFAMSRSSADGQGPDRGMYASGTSPGGAGGPDSGGGMGQRSHATSSYGFGVGGPGMAMSPGTVHGGDGSAAGRAESAEFLGRGHSQATKPDGAWNYHVELRGKDVASATVQFRTIFCQPRKVQPVSIATGSVWLSVTKASINTLEGNAWRVTYRFEHHHLTHTFTVPATDPQRAFADTELRKQLKQQAQLLASPLRRVEEVIASKERQNVDPRTQALFTMDGVDTFGRRGGTGEIPRDTSSLKGTFADAQAIMSRASLDAATTAHVPVDTKSWRQKTGRDGMSRERIRDELSKFRVAS
ncbi:hypothetical protein BC831DRAFT_551684 [Entophlyctis helioformis]|nr:hypothetical protein BC831DRAFT_551684 [Entophlyctis helioformis]